jgi:hypothetical protein
MERVGVWVISFYAQEHLRKLGVKAALNGLLALRGIFAGLTIRNYAPTLGDC